MFSLGLWSCAVYSQKTQKQDASEIVIDEVVGQWIALWPWLFLIEATLWGFAIGFALFRFFDILKPWPISLADKRHDALGIMLDDVIAGIMAAFIAWGIIHYAL